MTLRDLLNERRWRLNDLELLTLVVRHRGAPGDTRRVQGRDIVEVGATGLTLRAGVLAGDVAEETFLPYHRVLLVDAPEGPIYEHSDDP